MSNHPVIEKFKEWQLKHPDEDYQYDEVHEFFGDLSRGEMLDFMVSVSTSPTPATPTEDTEDALWEDVFMIIEANMKKNTYGEILKIIKSNGILITKKQ